MIRLDVARVHQFPDTIVTAGGEPEQVSLAISVEEAGEKVGHLLSKIPAVKRAAVNHRQPIAQSQLTAAARALFLVKREQRKIHATRNHLVMNRSPA